MTAAPEVLGPYVIYERLGAGGMATVHRAEHIGVAGFRKPVALKRLLPHVADEPAMREMFIHEARLASQLRHANVAATYDLGKVDDTYFIAMEYVPGPTLTQIMKQIVTAAGPMPVPIVVAILIQLCDALDHAHNLCDDAGTPLGIVHRDISPSNIIVSTSGIVKLIDFGIAKAATGGVKTQTGMIKGKYAYIAPEYMMGQLDRRADLFGVGIIAHELLTTRRLFNAASDYDTLKRLRELPIPPPSRFNAHVSIDLDDIVLTALQRDPDTRWQSAAAMRTALHNAARSLDGGGVLTNQQLADWVEWAFAQKPRTDPAGLVGALESLDVPATTSDNDVTTHRLSTHDNLEGDDDDLAEPPKPARSQRARRVSDPPLVIVDESLPEDSTIDRPSMPTLAGRPSARNRTSAPSIARPDDGKFPRLDSELPTPQPERESRPRMAGAKSPRPPTVTDPNIAGDARATDPRLLDVDPIDPSISSGSIEAAVTAPRMEAMNKVVPTSLPLGGPGHVSPGALAQPITPPVPPVTAAPPVAPAPLATGVPVKTLVAPSGLAPVVPASGTYLSPADRAMVLAGPPLVTPRDNDTGEVVVAPDPDAAKAREKDRGKAKDKAKDKDKPKARARESATELSDPEPRRWPWIVAGLTILLGVAAGIAYLIGGFSVDVGM